MERMALMHDAMKHLGLTALPPSQKFNADLHGHTYSYATYPDDHPNAGPTGHLAIWFPGLLLLVTQQYSLND
jgi:hypothetical protein